MTDFVATSVARGLIARMTATHQRRRISVFAGPPGIGKTTAIEEFARRTPGGVAVVKVARRQAREVLVLQHVLEALRRLQASNFEYQSSSLWILRRDIFGAACSWAQLDVARARSGDYPTASMPHLTLVFDEAQNLSRDAIEALRYWNDNDRCYAPFPLGLVFVGNNEFSLAGASNPDSVISAAVADRALYIQTLEYEDVVDDDLELFIRSKADLEANALASLLRAFRGPRSLRSLRRIGDLIDELIDDADGGPITIEDVRRHLVAA